MIFQDSDRSGNISFNGGWHLRFISLYNVLIYLYQNLKDCGSILQTGKMSSGILTEIVVVSMVTLAKGRFTEVSSGSIDGVELAEALRAFGYNLSPTVLGLVQVKYGMFHRIIHTSNIHLGYHRIRFLASRSITGL